MTTVRREPVARVAASPAAVALLARLADRAGPLLLHQSGGCCDGSAPMCYPRDEFLVGDRDVLLGVVGVGEVVGQGVPVYIGSAQFDYWSHTRLTIDVVPGRGSGFSLEAPEGFRFLTRSRLFTDQESEELLAEGDPPRGAWVPEEHDVPALPTVVTGIDPAATAAWQVRAGAGVLDELRELAGQLGEDIPDGLRESEARQKLEELRRGAGRRGPGTRRPVQTLTPGTLL